MQIRQLIDGWKRGRGEGPSVGGMIFSCRALTLKQMADVLSRQVSDLSFI